MKKSISLLFIITLGISSFSVVYGQKKKAGIKSAPISDTIHVVGHAHMDMNWLWTYSETMKMCNDNLRQAVAFMDEFPDYTLLQSQAVVYNFVEKVDPPLFKQMQKYVDEGRLELAGGMWTEGDMNLSSGEAITRSFLFGQRYFQSRFGKMTNIGWLPDNFGHIAQMPQILKLAGCDYFYFFRTKPYKGTYWWVGPDSSKVLVYSNDTYNGKITPELKDELKNITPDKHRLLQITGIGDHGGGPTRAEIDLVHQLDKTPFYPAVKFTTAEDFFRKASKEMAGRPTHRGEMQFIFEGCYTSVADIKEGNRNSENSLYASEFFNTLRWLNGDKYPAEELNSLWKTVTFNEFHDILPGSAINGANTEAIARYSEVLRMSTELRDNAFRKMADEVKFQSGMGQPVVAYNLHPFKHKSVIEMNVYSHNEPVTAKLPLWRDADKSISKNVKPVDKGQGDVASVLVRDASGKTYPAQVIWGKTTPPGFTSKVQIVTDEIPAGGYKTFYVDMTSPGVDNQKIPFIDNTFETDFFKVKIDMKTGGIVSLYDKRTKKEYVRDGGQLNKLRIILEDKKGLYKAWTLNKYISQEDVTRIHSVNVIENGPVRACVETVRSWGKSRFIERAYIYKSYPRIDYDMEVHWLETGTDSTDSPMLRAVFPVKVDNARFYCQTPFYAIERPVDGMINGKLAPSNLKHHDYKVVAESNDGQEVPAQRWVDISDGNTGIALLSRTKYGFSYYNGDLRLTLLRSAGSPDMYPNLGIYNISYALYPHSGNWTNGVWAEGDDFNVPVYAAEPPSLALVKEHASRPEEASFISVDAPGVILSGMKQAEDGKELIIRLFEIEGKTTTVNLKLPVNAISARRLNILEMALNNVSQPVVDGNNIQIKIGANEIVTLGILP
jgi:alpha-mannosidase